MTGLGWAGASQVTLLDGTVITDPANTQPTGDQCTPFECGADPSNSDVRFWCAYWGHYGALVGCIDPTCAPYRYAIPGCDIVAPTPAPAAAPFPTPPTPAPQVTTPPASLTPANIVNPLPDITQANMPVAIPMQDDSCWCRLNQAINDNPLIAVLVLAGVAMLVIPKGGR